MRKRNLTVSQIIILSFIGVIIAGTLLLMLPFATVEGESASFINALFTATSASCVTGLVVYDTATHFTLFGQLVILVLIQIGGLGVLSIAFLFLSISGKKISLKQREVIQESLASPKVGGMVHMLRFLIKYVFYIEMLGAILLTLAFIKDYGIKAPYYGLFHSISAFCNGGFDLIGNFNSLTTNATNPFIIFPISILIVVGGIGFLTWHDIRDYKFNFKRYSTQSKVVLSATVIILSLSFIYFFFIEFKNYALTERFYYAFFQSVTTRTAGFNNVDQAALDESGKLITIILMLIGGAPGSTAGGMKVVTISMIFLIAINIYRRKNETTVFKRRIAEDTLRGAIAIFTLYIFLMMGVGITIHLIENVPLIDALYEAASAIGTVGMSTGITSSLSTVSKILIIGLMFLGRVGGITLIYAANNAGKDFVRYPQEKLML
ncbi:MAG: potassium transporter TrkG [Erysipelotrichaceae bacterium]|nr:potassium transporter TrkG [Erysipelotrichaceae bacterium]